MSRVKLDIPAGQPVRARVIWFRWVPRERRESINFDIRKKVADSTPASADLRRWAAKRENQPKPAWFDEDIDPFSP